MSSESGARFVGFQRQKELALRKNIQKYEWMLTTDLTDHEREFVRRRLNEERVALQKLGIGCG